MTKENNIDESAMQEAWELALRGENITGRAMSKADSEIADILRSHVLWEPSTNEVIEVNKEDRQKVWEALAPQILPKEESVSVSEAIVLKNNIVKRKYWLAGLSAIAIIVLFTVIKKAPKWWPAGIFGVTTTTLVAKEETQFRSRRIKVAYPAEYSAQLTEDLFQAGFPVNVLSRNNIELILLRTYI